MTDAIDQITSWFGGAPGLVPDGETFAGVVVYGQARGDARRICVAVSHTDIRRGPPQLRASAQPSAAWRDAVIIGFASTLDDAVSLMDAP